MLQAGHLTDVFEHRDETKNFITGNCIPEMSVRKKKYRVEFHLDVNSRRIKECHCTCVAGASGQCKHSASLFLFIREERSQGKTDETQRWSAPSQKSQDLYPKGETIQNIFSLPKRARPSFKLSKEEGRVLAEEMEMFDLTDACLYKSLKAADAQDENEEEVEPISLCPPEEVKFLIENEIWIPAQQLQPKEEEARCYHEKVECDGKKAGEIFQKTLGQSQTKEWFVHKQFRISASKAHKISRARPENRLKYFIGSLGDHPNLR